MSKRASWHGSERDPLRDIRRFNGQSDKDKADRELMCIRARSLAQEGMDRNAIANYLRVTLSLVDNACRGIITTKKRFGKTDEPAIGDEELAERIEKLYRDTQAKMEAVSKLYDANEAKAEWDCLAWIRKQMEARGKRAKEAAASHGDKSQ